LFRLADIIKPWPISVVDQRVKGGIGVMLDDVLAGALAAIILWNIWMWTSI
ncbi:MAG: phosphatidylglycerophosphatase A, partial [Rhodospirillaceae bacterium]|nr:phosphatidylglycerophosphatase A [Rhodospirillaceae bacterium]